MQVAALFRLKFIILRLKIVYLNKCFKIKVIKLNYKLKIRQKNEK